MFLMLVEELLGFDTRRSPIYWATQTISWIILSLIATHCFTTGRFVYQSFVDRRHRHKEPSTLPYSVPFLGNALQAISNTHSFYEYVS